MEKTIVFRYIFTFSKNDRFVFVKKIIAFKNQPLDLNLKKRKTIVVENDRFLKNDQDFFQ